jgi:hypothetical protein
MLFKMRFVADGPDIPYILVSQQEEGQVLFVCGAGVSANVGLPLFRGLVEFVYKFLGESWEDHPAEREVMRPGGQLATQYDRMFRALERRLAGPDYRLSQTMRERIRDAVRRGLALKPNSKLEDHLCLLELSRDSEHRNRLLTTNFDTLFERAWRETGRPPLDSYACQAMPPPKGAAFSGILHLHGRLADPEIGIENDTELVLTSAEFGDAYLRSGWASRYLYDLVRTHVLVLVGYQAEDPPMRYLLEALEADRERFPDLKKVYAFASATEENELLQEALWRAKGVEPILYRYGSDGNHFALYRTLRAWRDYAENPMAWRRTRLSTLLSDHPLSATQADLDEIVSLLSLGDANQILGDLSPQAAWLPVLLERGALGLAAITASRWIASRADDPEMVRACAAAQPSQDALQFLEPLIDGYREQLPDDYREAWRRIRRAAFSQPEEFLPRWYFVQNRVKRGGRDFEVRRAIVDAFVPQLRVRRPFRLGTGDAAEQMPIDPKTLFEIYFEPPAHRPFDHEVVNVWPKNVVETEYLVKELCFGLENALSEARDVDYLKGFDRASFGVPSIREHPQNQYRTGFLPIIRLIESFWTRLTEERPSAAKSIATLWCSAEFLLFRRLYLHALMYSTIFSSEEACDGLLTLNEKLFWSIELRRESMLLMAQRWGEFPEDKLTLLRQRLLGGPPRTLFMNDAPENDEKWTSIRDHMIFVRIARIQTSRGEKVSDIAAALDEIRERHPEWVPGPDDRDDFHSWMSSSWGEKGDTTFLSSTPDEELVSRARRVQQENPIEYSQVWRRFCDADPERALKGLQSEAHASRWDEDALRGFFWAAANVKRQQLQRDASEFLLSTPDAALRPFLSAAVTWLRECLDLLIDSPDELSGPFLRVWDRLAGAVYANITPSITETDFSIEDLGSAALSEPGGVLAWALVDALRSQKPKAGVEFCNELSNRFEIVTSAEGRPGLLARIYLIRLLPWLHFVAPAWCNAHLVPLLELDRPEAMALWTSRLAGEVPTAPALFNALKANLLLLSRNETISRSESQGLAQNLMVPAIRQRLQPSEDWQLDTADVRRALRAAIPGVRHQAAWLLWNWMGALSSEPTDRAGLWRDQIGPFFRDVWPLDVASRDSQTSRHLVMMVLETGEAFPEAVEAVSPVLVPYNLFSAQAGLCLDRQHERLPLQYPQAMVLLLDALIDTSKETPPSDLGDVLNLCLRGDPALEQNPVFKRLNGIARVLKK